MKPKNIQTLFLIAFLCNLFFTFGVFSQLENTAELNCMEFTDDVTGITIGDNGTIRATTDGGASWVIKPSGTSSTLKKTADLSNDEIVVVGFSGTILKSTDMGETWGTKSSGINVDLYGVSFGGRDCEVGIAVGDNSTIVRSTNQGESWYTVSGNVSKTSQRYTSVSFGSESKGIIVGNNGLVLFSTNGGLTWFKTSSIVPSVNYKFVIMLSEEVAYATGENGVIIKTEDSGISWTRLNTGVNYAISRIRFADDQIAIITGSNGEIMKTNDAGSTFINEFSGTTNNLNCLFVVNESIAYTGGEAGIILKTTDGGTTWFQQGIYDKQVVINNQEVDLYNTSQNSSTDGTNVKFFLSQASRVTIKVYDVIGREVRTLVNDSFDKGVHAALFNGTNLASGTYYCRLIAETNAGISTKTLKVIFVK